MARKEKFVPNGDSDFVTMAQCFARNIAEDPAKFDIAQSDADELTESANRFAEAVQAYRFGGRSDLAKHAKDEARDRAEEIVRRLGRQIRNNKRLDTAAFIALGMRPRAAKAKILLCPQEPPRLRFVRAHHEAGGAAPMHELSFHARDFKSAKPDGAVRLELFADLVPPDEPIPAFPGANQSGRPWYLRSFTCSPIKLVPPMPRVPMRVVYWGRWADSKGNVGPFSATAVAWVEGGSHALLPGGVGLAFQGNLGGRQPVREMEDPAGPADRAAHYSVAVIEVQYAALNGPTIEVGEEQRQLEGPDAEGEAA